MKHLNKFGETKERALDESAWYTKREGSVKTGCCMGGMWADIEDENGGVREVSCEVGGVDWSEGG